jgi:acetyl-CoA carboxylase biotin carboxyl carrier protein
MNRMSFDPEDIRELAAILDSTGLSEIEISEKDRRIRIARAAAPANYGLAPVAVAAPAPAAAVAAPVATVTVAAPAIDASHPGAVTSPMVGVAYLSPDPESPTFVSVGQQVSAGQTLLLIEAMKTYNPIRATKAGKVTQIIAEDGSPVEYGEVLIVIE